MDFKMSHQQSFLSQIYQMLLASPRNFYSTTIASNYIYVYNDILIEILLLYGVGLEPVLIGHTDATERDATQGIVLLRWKII